MPDFNSVAAEDPETHPQGPPCAHAPPLFSPAQCIHTLSLSHTQGSNRKINSQDLQIAQRSEGSIFNAADVVIVQLPVGKQGRS